MRIKAFQGPQYICICLNCSYHQTASKELRGDELQAPFSSEFEFLPICYAALLISLWKLERNSISSENLLFFLDTLLTSPPTATQTRSTGFRWYFLLCNNYYLLPSRPEVPSLQLHSTGSGQGRNLWRCWGCVGTVLFSPASLPRSISHRQTCMFSWEEPQMHTESYVLWLTLSLALVACL